MTPSLFVTSVSHAATEPVNENEVNNKCINHIIIREILQCQLLLKTDI